MKNEFVYNPHGFTGHSHASSIVEFKNELYLSWYVYEDREHERGQIVVSKYDQTSESWEKAQFVFENTRAQSQGNPVIFHFNDTLYLYFVILQDDYWDSAQIYLTKMDEETGKWEQPEKVNIAEGIMVRHRPLVMGNQILIPAYDEKTMSTVIYSASGTLINWTEYSRINGEYIQGDIFAINQFELQMYLRAAGDNTKVIKAISSDMGKTWGLIRETDLHCPLSGIAAIQLENGHILVSNNHTEKHARTPISLNLSTCKGVNFDIGPWHVDQSNIELSYPTLLQDSKGIIHLAFTYNRKMIKHISFTEEEMKSKV